MVAAHAPTLALVTPDPGAAPPERRGPRRDYRAPRSPAARRIGAIAGWILHALAAAVGRLPMRALHALGDGAAAILRVCNLREARVARRNLELIEPAATPSEREAKLRAVLRATVRGAFETLRFWTRPERDNLAFIGSVHGRESWDAARAGGKGMLIAAPHYGNWELLNQWLASQAPITVLYRPPESAAGEAFLRRVRGRANVRQVAAGATALRDLVRTLAGGGVVGILPDQQPKAGDGLWAPFFGIEALSMTLLPRLARRTGATVLFAVAERRVDDAGRTRFDVRISEAPDALHDPDLGVAVAAMNAAVQAIAERDPTQYQWTYKRYSKQPRGSGRANPYRESPPG